jgi:hypothetical protein
MDAACFELSVRMTSPAYERGLRLIVQFASELSMRVLICGKIGMTLRTGKRIVDGGIELSGIDVGFDEFVIFECHYEAVLRMAG